jgi:hypothetical protein
MLPSVGMGTGLLCGGFRFLAFFSFIRHDPDGFLKYTRHLRAREIPFDWSFEFDRWQCNSLQVALMILQRAGLGAARLCKLMKAIGTRSPTLPDDPFERSCRVVDIWYRCLAGKLKTPSSPLPPQFYLSPEELGRIFRRLAGSSEERPITWLVRSKNDITPEQTPHIFVNRPPRTVNDRIVSSDLAPPPPELEEALPNDAIESLSEKLLQDILSVDTD